MRVRHRRRRIAGSRLGVLVTIAAILLGLPVVPAGATPAPSRAAAAPAFAATASLKPAPRFIGDTRGSSYAFTVTNTGASARIGAIEIDRPVGWKITRCARPAGWKATLTSRGTCRFRSAPGAVGDVRPGQSITLKVIAKTAPGRQDRTGTWSVVVSKTDELDGSGLKDAVPGDPGLTATLHTFEVTSVVATDASAPAGSTCPAAEEVGAGQTSTVVVCGRNRSTVALRPVLSQSSLDGSFVHQAGAFSSDTVAPGDEVVLARWTGTELAREPGTSHDVTATVGSASDRTSPERRVTDLVVTGHVPSPVDDAFDVLEDSPLTVTAGDGLLANDQDEDGDALQVTDHDQPAHGEVTVAENGSFAYVPDADQHGPDSFDYTVTDGTATTTATASIAVTPVNDAPSFVAGTSQVVNEDAGATTVTGWATGISAGPNETAQSVSFVVTTTDPGLFSTPPAVSPSGTLSFTPAADARGVATISVRIADDGGTGHGGVDRSPSQEVTVEVRSVNDAPSFTKGADQNVLEDSGAQSVSGWASAISTGPVNEAGQAVDFVVTNDNNALFSAQPAVSPDGTLTFTAAADRHGTATVTVAIHDDGGTANGGDETSDIQTITITVTPVNDPPSMEAVPDQTAVEDAGPQAVGGFAGSTDPGPHEGGQTVTVVVEGNDDQALFSDGPRIDADRALRYTPATDAFGHATVTLRPKDDGGTANGGDDTGDTRTFTIDVLPVNDAPSFAKGADQNVLEDSGAQSVSGWASAISTGPANEAGQAVDFVVTNDNNALFSAQPAVSPDGTLTFTAAADRHGTATVTVAIHDDGGTANGGDDTSNAQTLTITVHGVNDPPVARPKSYVVQANMKISLGGLLAGATDPGDAQSNPNPSFTIETITLGGGCVGCTVSNVNNANGTFDFDPPAGGTGTYEFTYRIRDNGGPGAGEVSAPQTVTLNVAGPVVWFVDPTSSTTGTGRLSEPFRSLASATNAVGQSTGQRIFVMRGDATGDVPLRTGAWLVSDAIPGAGFDAAMGITPPAGTIARPPINRSQRRVAGTVTLAPNAVVRGLDLAPPSGSRGLVGNGASGVLVEQASVTTVGARAVDLTDTWGTIVLTRVSASGADRGISLVRTNVSGGFLTITGTGSRGSGGLITGSTAPGTPDSPVGGVYLDRARHVTLRHLEVDGNNAHGIYAVNSPDLLIADPIVSGNVLHGIAVLSDGSEVVDVTVDAGTYLDNGEGGIALEGNGAGGLDFLVSDGTIEGCAACGPPITVAKGLGATGGGPNATRGSIARMTITNAEPTVGPGIRLRGEGNGAARIAVFDNTITLVGNRGIDAAFGGYGGTTTTDLIIAGNTLDLGGAGDGEGIRVEAGVAGGMPTSMCADIQGNAVFNAPSGGITVVDASATSFRLPGYEGPRDDLAAVESFLLAQNQAAQALASVGPGVSDFVGGGICTPP